MNDLVARLLIVAAFVVILLVVAGRRSIAAEPVRVDAPVAAAAQPAWTPWRAVPLGLREDDAGRIIALAAVAKRAHDAGILVDLRGAVEHGASPDDLVAAALDEAASPWRAWPKSPSKLTDPNSESA